MKIGILGGTFNPVHLGHIRLAEEARKKLSLDKIIFIPAYIPPHKSREAIVSSQDRYRMVELAVEKIPGLEVSDIEIRLKGTSYSINTVKELKKVYGSARDIFFIAGTDYAEELKTWKDIEELKRLCNFVMATRPGYDLKTPPENTRMIFVDTPDMSSTDIRSLIREGRDFRKFMPQEVYDYIVARQLYL